ncbi:MAG: hypothetical protein QF805_24785 [Pirellulaceae bacterium]|nr:hypothetical protein [Pirellulaceae bacterium]
MIDVELIGWLEPGRPHVPLADVARSVARLAQFQRVGIPQRIGLNLRGSCQDAVRTPGCTGQDVSSADHADRRDDESVLEPHSVGGEMIDVRRLDKRVSRTSERVVPLIVGEKKQNVRLLARRPLSRGQHARRRAGSRHDPG